MDTPINVKELFQGIKDDTISPKELVDVLRKVWEDGMYSGLADHPDNPHPSDPWEFEDIIVYDEK